MHRKILATCGVLVALGALMAIPAMSSAAVLRDNTTTAASGKIVAYNEAGTFTKLDSSFIDVECSEALITGSVHNNGSAGGIIRGTIEHASFRGGEANTHCRTNLGSTATVTIPSLKAGSHWCIENNAGLDTFVLKPRNCTAISGGEFTFIVHAGSTTCGFKRTENIVGTFTTATNHTTPATLKMNNGQVFNTEPVADHSIFCPATGTLENFEFQLYKDTDVATGSWRHAASVADPLLITP